MKKEASNFFRCFCFVNYGQIIASEAKNANVDLKNKL